MDKATFSREVAEALRENEESAVSTIGISSNLSEEDLVHTAYQQLCYDDPVGITLRGCQALQRALLNANSPYALSLRLVTGIHQYSNGLNQSCTRDIATATTNQTTTKSTTLDNPAEAVSSSSLIVGPESGNDSIETLGSAFALLAYCLHIQIPLQCCMATTTLSQAIKFLGSYNNSAVKPSESTTIDEAELAIENDRAAGRHEALNDAFIGYRENGLPLTAAGNNIEITNGHTTAAETDSLEEIFAAESDDSDYEFESEWNPEAHKTDLTRWVASMEASRDPLHLSTPYIAPDLLTWDDVAPTIAQLLESLPHASFLAIGPLHWKRGMSETMTQLCLALLVPASAQHSRLLTSTSAVSTDHWQRLGVKILNVFRDVTIHHVNSLLTISTMDNATYDATKSILDEYLRLIRILLQVHQHSVTKEVPPATWVGLSSLSALCGDVRMHFVTSDSKVALMSVRGVVLQIVQSNILEVTDDLTILLEKSIGKRKEDISAMQWTYLSLFQILTTTAPEITASFGLMPQLDAMPKDYAQTLLNSGLFRQWLVLWSQQNDSSSQIAVQDCLFDLCLASPSLLGKYAWRFPGLAEVVTSRGIESERSPIPEADVPSVGHDLVSYVSHVKVLLWNVLGGSFAASVPTSPKIQWKSVTKGTNGVISNRVITAESCQLEAWALFKLMSANTLRVLTDWRLRRQYSIDRPICSADAHRSTDCETILGEWDILVKRISTAPFLRKVFTVGLVKQDTVMSNAVTCSASAIIRAELAPIQRILTDWPHTAIVNMTTTEGNDSDNNGNDDEACVKDPDESLQKKIQKSRTDADHERMLIRCLRRSIKTIQAAFDDTDTILRLGDVGQQEQTGFSSKME
jgi:hypothetical protein